MTEQTSTHPLQSLVRAAGGFFRDIRVIQAIIQIVFTVAFFSAIYTIANNVNSALIAQGSIPSFGFLTSRAGFNLLETPAWYSAESTYWEAFQVGIINSLRVVIVGLVVSTILGIFIGIALLSRNWLVRNLSSAYVEVLRNTPLLVQLIFWYYVFMLEILPRDGNDLTFPNEGIGVVPLRVVLYPVLWLGVWVLSRRWTAYKGLLTGALYGAVAVELAQSLLGYSPTLFIGVGAVGAGAIALGLFGELADDLRGVAIGAGAVAVGQLVLVALFSTLTSAEILPADAFWFPITSALFVSRKAFAMPETFTTVSTNFWLAMTLIACVGATVVYVVLGRETERTGRAYPRLWIVLLIVALGTLVSWAIASNAPEELVRQPIWGALVAAIIGGFLILLGFGIVSQATLRMTKGAARVVRILLLVAVVAGGGYATLLNAADVLNAPAATPLPEGVVLENNRPAQIEDLKANDRFLARHEAQLSTQPLVIGMPVKRGTRFQQGTVLSPEYLALTIGLIIYTSAFIGEIVRAGIQAVPYGQFEAARALGLNGSQSMQMIILPQALRVIIPPLGNQYLNLAKNSSLASAVAFADVYSIGQTVMNQSGQSITGFLMILLFYLSMSLIIAFLMNVVNSRFQLVTR
jgi:general L-amino acid transport system permease protein